MNKDNISALIMAIAVVSLITGFAIYFNSPYLNKAASSEQQESNFIPASIDSKNGTTISQIDKSQFKKAPDFVKITGYINTEEGQSINLKDLKGKVVLVDFWTYSCINCIRTLPYLVDWNEKYADKGLVIVGVHSPEFEFEKNIDNVKAAVQKYGIKYPVIQDNDKGTWDAYQNRYWPRKYLVDNEGYIRYDHIGEGGYAETEKVIQSLLVERAAQTGISAINLNTNTNTTTPENVQTVDFTKVKTPELYFGYEFARAPLGNSEGFKPNQTVTYSVPQRSDLKPNTIYLIGDWKNNADNMELQSDTGSIALAYSAKSVNIVAGGKGEGEGEELSISEDGVALTNKSGIDLSEQGKLVVDGQRLYNLVMHEGYDWHSLIIDVKGKGFQIYTFTFG
ncbi:MAG TPA: thioredoxin family protein [Nitrososphaeraceae archaeon]|jgi:thiol-disulfide isomerase/thioredoxin|nr:thioredoxin family protein [Nitrososphaeraceae archaeon]